MAYTTIVEYNNYLVDNKLQIDIIDYVKEANKLEFNIDIHFIDEFIELVDKKECCIHHNMLQKYGILTLNNGSNNIKRILTQNNFKENKDYQALSSDLKEVIQLKMNIIFIQEHLKKF